MELFTEKEYQDAKQKDKLKMKCDNCGKVFFRGKKSIIVHRTKTKLHGCSNACRGILSKQSLGLSLKMKVICKNCGKVFKKMPSQIKRSKNNFCSQSCAATYNNTHKTTGTRRSKLEAWLEQELPKLFPNITFHFNRKDAINSELDIYIPNLKLAFELNGIFHYEPIYGKDKLSQVQNNDSRKFQACLERGIELCIIDTSSQGRFSPKSSMKFLNIISSIISSKLVN